MQKDPIRIWVFGCFLVGIVCFIVSVVSSWSANWILSAVAALFWVGFYSSAFLFFKCRECKVIWWYRPEWEARKHPSYARGRYSYPEKICQYCGEMRY